MYKYIGLDGHSSTCDLCVISETGKVLDNTRITTNGWLLKEHIRGISGTKKLGLEESEISGWLYSLLKDEVDELVVCNPVENKAYKKAKTDKIDAYNLAQLLRGGFLKPVYHDGSDREKYRGLISGYQDLVSDAVRLKNRYKALFRKSGTVPESRARLYTDDNFLQDLKRPDYRFVGHKLYSILEKMERSREEYVEEIIRYNKKFKETRVLVTIPGIGEIQAAKIVSQVIDPRRFENKYKFFSYCGLVRHRRESGDKLYGSTKIHGNRTLKCVYKMAGHSALRGNGVFRTYHDSLRAKGISDKNAYNAVCRKIAAISLSVWKNNKKFNEKMFLAQIANG